MLLKKKNLNWFLKWVKGRFLQQTGGVYFQLIFIDGYSFDMVAAIGIGIMVMSL